MTQKLSNTINYTKWISSCICLSLLLTFFPVLPAHAAPKERTALLDSFSGEVSIKRGGDRLLKGFEGMRLEAGDTIITGDDSLATLLIDYDKTIDVDANTEITIDELSGNAEQSQTSASIFFGTAINKINKKLTTGSAYETRTSNAIMGVRGTAYLSRSFQGGTDLLVVEGIVHTEVSGNTSDTPLYSEDVTAGSQFTASANEIDTPPVPLSYDTLATLSPAAVSNLVSEEAFLRYGLTPANGSDRSTLLQILETEKKQLTAERKSIQNQLKSYVDEHNQQAPDAFFHTSTLKPEGANPPLDFSKNQMGAQEPSAAPKSNSSKDGIIPVPDVPGSSTNQIPANAAPGIQNPGGGQTPPNSGNQNPGGGQTPPDSGNQNPGGGQTPPDSGNQNPGGGQTPPDSGNQNPGGGQTPPDSGNQNPGGGQTPPDSGNQNPDLRPEVSVGVLQADAVYEDTQLKFLAITHKALPGITGYQYSLAASNGTYSPFSTYTQVQKNGWIRLLIAADQQSSLQGKTLRVAPVVGSDQIALSSDLVLDFTASPSSRVRVLPKPAADQIQVIYGSEEKKVTYPSVDGASSYHVIVTLDESTILEQTIGAALPGILLLPDNITGSMQVSVQALGDGFDTFDSKSSVSAVFELETDPPTVPDPVQLAAPSATCSLDINAQRGMIVWGPVENTSSYELSFSDLVNSYSVTGNIHIDETLLRYYYSLTSTDMLHTARIQIRSISEDSLYSNSEWVDVTIE